ncbi:DUF1800 domain-containing protein [Acidovorax radicis]|jgi:uncharacterized protein (DUF1800 family)|uniref:DUF1800 domain-containing protein n=1 Tax=Acidovorax radicis TaxID=758826 RepID=UPI001CFB0986|nr:DUF1800 domain-containing protein [Acidovorax radicis]UCU99542.1 DUF1800 domain-containing protein [Acidovorax radicis]
MNTIHDETMATEVAQDFHRLSANNSPTQLPSGAGQRAIGASALAASAALAACGGGGNSSGGDLGSPGTSPGSGTYRSASTDQEAARFLLQAQFAASTADIAALRATTYADWLESQFNAPASLSGWDWLNQRGYADISKDTAYYDNSYPADYMIWYQLMKSPDGLRKRVALALSEICVVSTSGVDVSWRSHAMAWYWDQLVNNAFGNYRSVLQDVTLNAAMGYYLNTRGNQKENTATGRQPDENYAREVMQLMSIGLAELHPDGTPKKDSAGKPVDSYTLSDVSNLARVFTGYDYDQSQNTPSAVPGTTRTVPSPTFARLPMALTASRHSTLAATFLGTSVPANTAGPAALKIALDALFNHANVGPFIGKQLIQRLVTSNPSPAYVARVAAAFNNNGTGVRGDMRAVIRAILLDDEARAPAGLTAPGFGKLREPMLRLVQWGRTFGLESAKGSWKIGDLSDPGSRLGQSPLRSPSVFNFFRPGYVPPSTALAAGGAVAPEFQLVNESSVGGYLNYMQGVIRNGLYVNAPELPNNASTSGNGYDLKASYASELALAADADALVARINLLMCAGQLSNATTQLIANALKATPVTAASTDSTKLDRVAAAIFLVMASAEYLVQK